MTKRFDGSILYSQNFNVENELISVVVNNGNNQTTTFAYDASGLRTKTVEPAAKTTYTPFLGVEEEVAGRTITGRITYSLGGQAIALRVQIVNGTNTLYTLHSDHLGSTRLMSDNNGDPVFGSTTRYYPFGDWRTEPTANLTDRGYTGHQHNNLAPTDLGLIYMNARYYLSAIARFASADTLIPNPQNPQSYNRYTYGYNNPIRFSDPTGHANCDMLGDANDTQGCNNPTTPLLVDFVGNNWTAGEKSAIQVGAWMIALAFYKAGNGQFASPSEAFLAIYGSAVSFEKSGVKASNLGWADKENHIFVNNQTDGIGIVHPVTGAMWAVHELGHAFNYELNPNTTDDLSYGQGIIDLAVEGVWVDGERIAGNRTTSYANDNEYVRTGDGYRPGLYSVNGGPYQQNAANAVGEDYADMFMNWAFNSFASDVYGQARYRFMDDHISAWINLAVTNNQ